MFQFNNTIKKHLSSKNSTWIPRVSEENEEISLFRFGRSPGYAEKEVRLLTFEWKLYINKTEMDTSHCDLLSDIPRSLRTVKVLVQLLDIVDNHKMCEGCGETENYRWLNNYLILYKTKDGKNTVYVENEKIRSTNCQLFLPNQDRMCTACKKSLHYLRTLTSRKKAERTTRHPEKARLDYKSKSELLDIARQSAIEKKKALKIKNKRLQMSVENMVEIGTNSNNDLKKMFESLYNGVLENRSKQERQVTQTLR